MKKEWIFTGLSALAGILISIMPRFLVCAHCIEMGMRCAMSVKVQFAIGALILLLAIVTLFMQSHQVKMGMSLSIVLFGVLSGLVSTILIGFCNGGCSTPNCQCNPYTTIIMIALSVLVVITAILQSLYFAHQD